MKANRKVVAFARNATKLRIPKGSGGEQEGLELMNTSYASLMNIITGNVLNVDDIERLFDNFQDITSVIVVLGGRTKDVGLTMLTNGTRNIVNSMKKRNIKRIAIVTSIGTGDSMVCIIFIHSHSTILNSLYTY